MRRGAHPSEGPPLLTFTDLAREKLEEFAQGSDESSLALRIAIVGRGPNGFQYDLQLIPPDNGVETDTELQVDGWSVLVSESSMPYMEGVTLGFKETLMGGGFHFENPNPLWLDDMAQRVQEVITTEVNPAVASHGGTVLLVDVSEGEAIISFGGGCQGCAAVDATLKNGVERMICDKIPEIVAVRDVTDHSAGTNPFY